MSFDNCIRKISIDEAKKKITNYDYIVIYEISNLIVDSVSNISEINWDECIEIYAFNDKSQLHIFNDESELKASVFCEDSDMKYYDKPCNLKSKFAKPFSKKSIIERKYFEPDEDGQMCVKYTRLIEIR